MVQIPGVVAADARVDLPIVVQSADGITTAASPPDRSLCA